MTTFQDPQPQSRRAVRQGERGDGTESPAGFTEFPPQPTPAPAAPQYFSDPDAQRDMWDTNARRAAQLPAAAAPRSDAAVTDRRAAPNASQPPAAAEPLNYSTASRQPLAPSYDPQSFRSRLDARQAQQPVAPEPQGDQSFRVRDFSPEGRRVAHAAERAAAAPLWIPTTPSTDLDYQTEVREGFGAQQEPTTPPAPISQVPQQFAAQPIAAEPVAPPIAFSAPPSYSAPQPTVAPRAVEVPFAAAAPMADAPGEQTLSRRELRALLAEQEAGSGMQHPEQVGQATYNAPVAWRTPEAAPAQQAQQAAPAVFSSVPLQAPQPYEAIRIPEVVMPPAAPQPSPSTGMTGALAEFDAITRAEPAFAAPPVLSNPGESAAWRAPVGHWSLTDIDDDEIETTISRRVGSGSSVTNALVLPEIPLGSDIRGPLTSTGEVMLTGSINLPHSLSSTGASEHMEHAGIDSLFELNDHEVISTDSQPVRAIKAVSTHQNGHGVTHTQKPKGTRALTVLLISASSMAVIVAGLLVAAFAFNIF